MPKRIMRGKIKFFSTRPFELHRPRDHALLLLVLYTVYTFRGKRPPSLPLAPLSLLSSFSPRLLAYSFTKLSVLALLSSPFSYVTLFARWIYKRWNSHRESLSLSLSDRVSRNVPESRIRVYLNAVEHSERSSYFTAEGPAEILRRRCWRV